MNKRELMRRRANVGSALKTMQKLLAGISLSNKWVLPGRFPMWGGSVRHFPSDVLKKSISFRFN